MATWRLRVKKTILERCLIDKINQPIIDLAIDHKMNAVFVAMIRDAVILIEIEIPKLARAHFDELVGDIKFVELIGNDVKMQKDSADIETHKIIAVFENPRARAEQHKTDGLRFAFDFFQNLANIPAAREDFRVGKIFF